MSDTDVPTNDHGAPTVETLVAAVAKLDASVQVHNENTKLKLAALAQENRLRKRSIRLMRATIVADLMVTLLGLVVLHSQGATNHRIQESLRQNYATTQQQAVTRVRVLCPLYTVLLAAAADPTRAASLNAAQRAVFDRNVQVIRDGYSTLGCQPPLPGASPTS